MAYSVQAPPKTNRYQLARLMRGKARSLAPIISGRQKLPSTVGTTGTKKKKTMMTPCMVKSLL